MKDSDTRHPLVTDYLHRLEAATADLEPEVRADLLADVHAHIDEAASRAGDEAALREALDRLGTPEAIAAEARGTRSAPPPPPAGPPRTSRPGYDIAALLTHLLGAAVLGLAFGSIGAPVVGALIGWVVGLGLLLASRSWTPGEKLLGALVWPAGLLTPGLMWSLTTQVCTTVSEGGQNGTTMTEECTGFAFHPAIGIPLALLTIAAPLIVTAVLLRRADRRR